MGESSSKRLWPSTHDQPSSGERVWVGEEGLLGTNGMHMSPLMPFPTDEIEQKHDSISKQGLVGKHSLNLCQSIRTRTHMIKSSNEVMCGRRHIARQKSTA